MGLMDKVKQQAEQALAKAQQGVNQGQAKLDQVQAKRQADALLRDLGAAYYALQRTGGSQDAVDAALKLVDEHAAVHGPVDSSSGEDGATVSPAAQPTGAEPAEAQPAAAETATPPSMPTTGATATAGDFNIDDM